MQSTSHKGFRKGIFKPKNPHKYMGKNIDSITYRSSWEKKVFDFLDNNFKILGWCSEPFAIPYLKPDPNVGFKKCLYYPDLYVEYVDKDGIFKKDVLEIKPKKQTQPSKARKAMTKLYENYVYAVNMAKFQAADAWCKNNGYHFEVMTEQSIFTTRFKH